MVRRDFFVLTSRASGHVNELLVTNATHVTVNTAQCTATKLLYTNTTPAIFP